MASVRLTEDEVQEFLATSHTGVLSTLRRDGSPASMPMWFVLLNRNVYVRTLAASPKAAHVRSDPRVSFVVESGRAWSELKAVVLYGRAVIESNPATITAIDAEFAVKYAAFQMPATVADVTRRHYAADRVHIRIEIGQEPRTWDNAKLLR